MDIKTLEHANSIVRQKEIFSGYLDAAKRAGSIDIVFRNDTMVEERKTLMLRSELDDVKALIVDCFTKKIDELDKELEEL